MKTIRYVERVLNVPEGAKYKYGEFRNFLRSLDTCLTYHHDEFDTKPEAQDGDPELACLNKDLYENFFDSLYIERQERQSLYELTFEKKVVLFSGSAGTGKTTILSKLKDDINNIDSSFVHYINLKKVIKDVDMQDRQDKPLCHYIFQDIYKRLFDEKKASLDLYKLYRLQKHPEFFYLFSELIEEVNPENDEQWLNAINGEYKNEENELRKKVHKDHCYSHSNLRVLLGFLSSKFTEFNHVILLLDNIDRFKLPVQKDVVQTAIDIRGVNSILIAIRTRNLEDLKREESSGAGGDIVRWEETTKTELQTGNEIIKHLIKNRISFLRKHHQKHHNAYLPHLSDFEGLLQTVTNVKHCKVLAALDAWYNGSLRHISSNMAMFIGRILAEADEAHPLDKICANGKCTDDLEVHNLRNALFKYMICNDMLRYDNSSGSRVRNIYSSDYAKELLPFPEFAVLNFLYIKKHRIAFKDLKAQFAVFGLSADELLDIVKQLRLPQGRDGFGFLMVESQPGLRSDKLIDNDLLELLPTGKYFIDFICVSCEYTFWMALDTYTHVRLFNKPFKGSINYSDTKDDGLRALISARFMLTHILPLLEKVENLVKNDNQILEAYRQIFPDKYAHVSNFSASLAGFVNHIPSSESVLKQSARDEFEKIQKKINA